MTVRPSWAAIGARTQSLAQNAYDDNYNSAKYTRDRFTSKVEVMRMRYCTTLSIYAAVYGVQT